MSFALSRRQFFALSAVGVLGAGGYGLTRAIEKERNAAHRSADLRNLKQLSLAVASYESANEHFPSAFQLGPNGQPWHSWRVLILPFIEENELFKQYRFDEPWNGPNNSNLASRMPRLYAFHGKYKPGLTTTNYLAVVGKDTMWPGANSRKRAEMESASNTILIAENNGLEVHWMEPRDLNTETMSFEFNHPHGLSSWYTYPSAAMVDGSLNSFSEGYDEATLRAMLTVRAVAKPADPAVQPLPDGRMREKVRD
jgi:hypothetical protein